MLKVSVPSPGCGTEYKLSWTKGIAITSPGSRVGLCSSSALKLPEAPLRWKRRGVKLYFPGSDSTHHIIFCLILKFKVREEGNVLGGEKVERRWREGGEKGVSTLQHAVVGLPVHLPQCGPEVRRLRALLHHLHRHTAALAQTQL